HNDEGHLLVVLQHVDRRDRAEGLVHAGGAAHDVRRGELRALRGHFTRIGNACLRRFGERQLAGEYERQERARCRFAAPQAAEIARIGRRLVARNRWCGLHDETAVGSTAVHAGKQARGGKQRAWDVAQVRQRFHIGGSPCLMRSRHTSSFRRAPCWRRYCIFVSHGAEKVSGSSKRMWFSSVSASISRSVSVMPSSSLCGRPAWSMIVSCIRPVDSMTSEPSLPHLPFAVPSDSG